jgi:serine/threonine protein phosphatase PrpC
MTAPRLRAAGDTHAGLQRDNNEDRFFFDDRRGIFCVIDGVGGQLAGERAAEIAAETIRARLGSNNGISGSTLREALAAANDAIFQAASQDRTLNGMACVATLAVADGERLRFGHVGDTRLFKIRDGGVAKLTHDHSPVGELEDSGALTEVEAMRHPRRNEIYRDLGSQPRQRDDPAFIEIGEAPFERDAALVLCSDGLSDLVSSGSVRRIVEAHAGAPALAVQELITAANDAGGKDNVTVLVVEGDRFAEAVAARGGRRGRSSRPPAGGSATTATAPSTMPLSERPSRPTLVVGLALVAGLLLGALAVLGAQRTGWTMARLLSAVGLGAPGAAAARTWRVGLDADADFATIGEALAKAAAGDTVAIGPGEYREGLMLPAGVALVGTRESVLKPPLGAPADFVAITVRRASGGRIAGLRVAGSAEQRLGTGVRIEEATVALDDLEITATSIAGVDFRAGSGGELRRSFVHGNGGPGVVIRAAAEPHLSHNVILHNGTGPGSNAPGVLVEAGARPTIVANGIGNNGGPAVAGWPAATFAELAQQNVLTPAPPSASAPAPAPRRPPARNRVP